MNPLHIPAHIDMTRRIAVQQAADVTRLTVEEQQLKTQLDEHQRAATAERERIEAELLAMREQAERRLNALTEQERTLTSQIREVGRQREQHADEARQAQESVLDWCTRRGINPDELPALADTGPLPVIPAAAEQTPPATDVEPLLALGRRMADPASTRTDPPAGGEEPAQGDFQAEADRA